MARIFITAMFTLTISICGINAQHQYTSAGDSDPEATALLALMDQFLNKTARLQAAFEMSIAIPGEEVQNHSGTFDQEGPKYIISLESYKIICNGIVRWVYIIDQNEVNIYDAGTDDSPSTPIDFLQLYQSQDFVYRIVEEANANDEKSIEFKPLDKYSDYVKVRLTLIEDTGRPLRVELFEKGGGRTDLRITDIVEFKNFPQDHFVFTPGDYPGIIIEDLRID